MGNIDLNRKSENQKTSNNHKNSYSKARHSKQQEDLLHFDQEPVNSQNFDIGYVTDFVSNKFNSKKSSKQLTSSHKKLIDLDSDDDSMINPNFNKETDDVDFSSRGASVNDGSMAGNIQSETIVPILEITDNNPTVDPKKQAEHCHVFKNEKI